MDLRLHEHNLPVDEHGLHRRRIDLELTFVSPQLCPLAVDAHAAGVG